MNLSEIDKYIDKLTCKKRSLEIGDKISLSKNCDDKNLINKESTMHPSLIKTLNHKSNID